MTRTEIDDFKLNLIESVASMSDEDVQKCEALFGGYDFDITDEEWDEQIDAENAMGVSRECSECGRPR